MGSQRQGRRGWGGVSVPLFGGGVTGGTVYVVCPALNMKALDKPKALEQESEGVRALVRQSLAA